MSNNFVDCLLTSVREYNVACYRAYVHEMLQSPPDGVMLVARLVPQGDVAELSCSLSHA